MDTVGKGRQSGGGVRGKGSKRLDTVRKVSKKWDIV